MPRTLMLPTYLDGDGDLNTASARIRAYWVAKNWDECDFYNGTQDIRVYDALIFQKLYLDHRWPLEAQLARARGQSVYFDLCDPVWEQGARGQLMGMLALCNAAIASTELIREWLARFLPAFTIGDYVDLTEYPSCYRMKQTDADITAVWYGYSANYSALAEFIPELDKRGVKLVTISDRSLKVDGVQWIPWERETVNQNLVEYDFVVNPKGLASRWAYKSDNKTSQAWALGCPVAHTTQELDQLMSWKGRQTAHKRALDARPTLDIQNAVNQWKQIIRG